MKITLYLSRNRGSLSESCEIVKYFQEGTTCVCRTKVEGSSVTTKITKSRIHFWFIVFLISCIIYISNKSYWKASGNPSIEPI